MSDRSAANIRPSWKNDAAWEGDEEDAAAEGNPWSARESDSDSDAKGRAKAKGDRVTSSEWQQIGAALDEINPNCGDSDSSAERKNGGVSKRDKIASKIGGGGKASHTFHSGSPVKSGGRQSGNPFSEDSDEDSDVLAPSPSRPKGVSVKDDSPPKENGRRNGTPLPTKSPADSPSKRPVAIAPIAAEKLVYKQALRSLMLMGYRQSFASANLVRPDIHGSEALFCAFALKELRKAPGGTGVDHNIWRPVLNARVTSWMPETDEDGRLHTAYTVRCFLDVPAHSSWHVSLRYSRLKELNADLYRYDSSGARDPKAAPFPPSGRGLGLMADKDQRKTDLRVALDAWLRDVLFDAALAGSPATSAAIFAALDVMAHAKIGGAVKLGV